MKTPNPNTLNQLRKAAVTDPVIAGNNPNASNTGNTGNVEDASHASNAGKTSKGGKDSNRNNASNTGRASNTGSVGNASDTGKASSADAKFTIRMSKDMLGRIRAAYLHDLTNGFSGSLSAWATGCLEAAVQQSERENNHGTPYLPIETGSIPTGVLPSIN